MVVVVKMVRLTATQQSGKGQYSTAVRPKFYAEITDSDHLTALGNYAFLPLSISNLNESNN